MAQKVRYKKLGEDKNAILDGWAEEFEDDMEDGHLSQKWGFPEDEVRTMRDCFEFADVDGSGKIQSSELMPFMGTVGYVIKSKKQEEALATAVNGRHLGDGFTFAEAVEIVFTYEKQLSILALGGEDRKVQIGKLLNTFYSIGGYMTPKTLELLLQQSGIREDASMTPKSAREAAKEMIDFQDFRRLLRASHSLHMNNWCESCGFTPENVEKFGSAFTELLATFGSSGCELPIEQVQQLLFKFNLVRDDEDKKKEKLCRATARVDRDNSGTMSFQEFLLLVRNFKNKDMYENTQKNQRAMIQHGLQGESGEQLLSLFTNKDTDQDFCISQQDILRIFKDLGVAKTESQLEKINTGISVWSKGDKSLLVQFPDFLEILKDIEDRGRLT